METVVYVPPCLVPVFKHAALLVPLSHSSSSSTTLLSITFKLSDNTTPMNSTLHNSYCHYNSAITILLHVLIAFHICSTVLMILSLRMGS